MKKLMLLTMGCLLAIAGAAQSSKTDHLIKNVWKIQSDEMSGLGVHNSIPNDTELQFSADGNWKSSQPIKGVTEGTWRLENKDRNLMISTGDEEISYLVLQLTDKELHYRFKKNAATYTYKWLSKK